MSPMAIVRWWARTLREEGAGALKMAGAAVILLATVVLAVFLAGKAGVLVGGLFGMEASKAMAAGRGLALLGFMFFSQKTMLFRLVTMESRIRGIASETGLGDETTGDLLSAASNGVFGGAALVLFGVFAVMGLQALSSAGL